MENRATDLTGIPIRHWSQHVVSACIVPHCAVTGFFDLTFTFEPVDCVHNQKGTFFHHVTVNFDIWPWPSKLTCIESSWTSLSNTWVDCHLVQKCGHTDTAHTQRTVCSTWTTKVVSKNNTATIMMGELCTGRWVRLVTLMCYYKQMLVMHVGRRLPRLLTVQQLVELIQTSTEQRH